jgi:adenosylhomocysteinase
MDEAAKVGDIFCTATGCKDVIVKRHFEAMKDGAIVCNTGHYDSEINITDLEALAKSHRMIRPNCEEYLMADGRRIYLLAEGRLINLAAAEGHPSEVMDMSFANQFMAHLSLIERYKAGEKMPIEVMEIPATQDENVASTKLSMMNLKIDVLTEEQIHYMNDYNAGT